MQLTTVRAASIIACVAAVAAVAAGAAQAVAVSAATQAATPVTATTATLNGILVPAGAALSYEFEYGLADRPGFSSDTTAVSVSGVTASTDVLAEITGLKPSTKYKFQLVTGVQPPAGSTAAPSSLSGGVLTFTTGGAGKVSLTSRKLKVRKGRVVVRFNCASTLTCTGKVSITAKTDVGATVACGTASFTIAAGERQTVRTHKVSASCKALLTDTPGNVITARLKARFTTYQSRFSKSVTLTS